MWYYSCSHFFVYVISINISVSVIVIVVITIYVDFCFMFMFVFVFMFVLMLMFLLLLMVLLLFLLVASVLQIVLLKFWSQLSLLISLHLLMEILWMSPNIWFIIYIIIWVRCGGGGVGVGGGGGWYIWITTLILHLLITFMLTSFTNSFKVGHDKNEQ